jgi:uncharacterized protein (TIGR03437 family)
VHISVRIVLLLVPLLLAMSVCSAQTPVATGSMHGVVQDPEGRPVAGAVVYYSSLAEPGDGPGPPSNIVSGRVTVGADGRFVLDGLRPARYSVCAEVPSAPYLNPCVWGEHPYITVSAGVVSTPVVVLEKGVYLNVRVNDPIGVFCGGVEGMFIQPKVRITLYDERRSYGLMNVSADAGGRNYRMIIPAGRPLQISANSQDSTLTLSPTGLIAFGAPAGQDQNLAFTITASTAAPDCLKPVISSVVDAASYAPTRGIPGAVATIFGSDLSLTTAQASILPLLSQIGHTRVEWNGVPAKLYYVSPRQINLQVPAGVRSGKGVAGIVVYTGKGDTAPYRPEVETPSAWAATGLFSADGSGCGQGAVLNVAAADGKMTVNSAANSASPGEWLSAYGTGISLSQDAYPPDGYPAPFSPLIHNFDFGGGVFDLHGDVIPPGFNGLSPGLVGVGQYNLQIPATVREGCAVPLQMEFRPSTVARTQPVTVAVRKGGGACVDPPEAGYGEILFERRVATGTDNTVTESETVTVSLQASPGKQRPPGPDPGLFVLPGSVAFRPLERFALTLTGPACSVSGYRSLDAGAVTVRGPGLGLGVAPVPAVVMPYEEGQLGGLTAYRATLTKGALQGGTYTVTASGGGDVGQFQATAQIGADIQLETPLAGVHVWEGCAAFVVRWRGGDPSSWVTFKLIRHLGPASKVVMFSYRARTSSGGVVIPAEAVPDGGSCHQVVGPVELVIEVEPDPAAVREFSAPGLSLGGRVSWRYVHSFEVRMGSSGLED